jgi:hypothetical protein
MITLELGAGDARFITAGGELPLALGIASLRARWLREDPPKAAGLEAAIETVEDAVMPLHGRWPRTDLLQVRSAEAALASISALAGTSLDIEDLEALFQRAAAVALGRPASADPELARGEVVAALVILREVMHHLGFTRLALYRADQPMVMTRALGKRA